MNSQRSQLKVMLKGRVWSICKVTWKCKIWQFNLPSGLRTNESHVTPKVRYGIRVGWQLASPTDNNSRIPPHLPTLILCQFYFNFFKNNDNYICVDVVCRGVSVYVYVCSSLVRFLLFGSPLKNLSLTTTKLWLKMQQGFLHM